MATGSFLVLADAGERNTVERMIPHFIYLREGTKFANILASAWHASRSGHLLVVEGAPALLLPLEGSLVLHELLPLPVFQLHSCKICQAVLLPPGQMLSSALLNIEYCVNTL